MIVKGSIFELEYIYIYENCLFQSDIYCKMSNVITRYLSVKMEYIHVYVCVCTQIIIRLTSRLKYTKYDTQHIIINYICCIFPATQTLLSYLCRIRLFVDHLHMQMKGPVAPVGMLTIPLETRWHPLQLVICWSCFQSKQCYIWRIVPYRSTHLALSQDTISDEMNFA